MKFCSNCGKELSVGTKFCPACGAAQPETGSTTNQSQPINQPTQQNSQPGKTVGKSLYASATEKLNQFTGESGPVNVNLRTLFSEVFRHHTKDEAETVFIAGTKTTTPAINEISSDWAKPWLFSRIFLVFALGFAILLFAWGNFRNPNVIPGIILFGAFAVPVSAVGFFYESNTYRNISLYEVTKVFLIGGAFSLVVTLFLYGFVTFSAQEQLFGMMTFGDALSVGVVEEIGKLLILIYFVSQMNIHRILNGILIGAAIGGGFASLETAGYIYSAGNDLFDVALIRGITAIGGHIAWCAIAGGALIIVKKSNRFDYHQLLSSRFLVFFVLAIAFHTVWDMEISGVTNLVKYAALIVAAWIVIFVLLSAGLKEVGRIQRGELPE